MAKAKTGSVVDLGTYDYKRTSIRGKDGKVRHSAGNQDAVFKAMLVATAAGVKLEDVVKANGLDDKFKGRKVSDGPGLYRMSLGVALRALVNAGTPVKIGSITVKTLKQHVDVPKVEKVATAKAKKNGRKKLAA